MVVNARSSFLVAGSTTAINALGYTGILVGSSSPAPGGGLSALQGFFLLDHLEVWLDTLAAGPAKCSAFLSWDAAGDYPCQPVVEVDITPAKTTATRGAVLIGIDSAMVRPPASLVPLVPTSGLYVWLKLDAGTANATPVIHGGV